MKIIITYLFIHFFAFQFAWADPINILFPLHNSTVYVNDEIEIKWSTDSEIKVVTIEFSIDAGKTWGEILTGVPSKKQLAKWQVPIYDEVSCWIRVVSEQNANHFSIVQVKINQMKLAETYYKWTKVSDSTLFFNRDGAGALVFNNKVWLLGGWHRDSIPRTNNEIWNSDDGINWRFVAKAPWERRHTAGYLVLDQKMYVLGGDVNSGHYQNDVWATADGKEWEKVTDSVEWGSRVLFQYNSFRNKLWIMGGQTLDFDIAPDSNSFYNDVWTSDDGREWKQVQQNAGWSARGAIIGAPVFKGKMWIIGGGTYKTAFYNDVWSSSDGINWTQGSIDNAWMRRYYHNVVVFDNRLFLLGGWNQDNLNDVFYSDDGKQWTALTGTPWTARHAASVYVFKHSLYITCGPLYEKNAIYELREGIKSIQLNRSGEIEFQTGENIMLRTEYVLGASYKWYRNNRWLKRETGNTINVRRAGKYHVSVISKLGENLESNMLIVKKQ